MYYINGDLVRPRSRFYGSFIYELKDLIINRCDYIHKSISEYIRR